MTNKLIETATDFLNANLPTKYRIIDYYNQHCIDLVKKERRYKVQYSDNWCATFTSVIAHKCGLTKEQFPYECGVMEQVKLAKANNSFTTDVKEVKAGDLIIYDWNTDKWSDHVGFIIKVNEDNIHVIEGNIKNTVGYRTIPKTSKSIQGFIKVQGVQVEQLVTNKVEQLATNKDSATDERIANLARLTWTGEFGTGDKRKVLLGADFEVVQKYINTFYT